MPESEPCFGRFRNCEIVAIFDQCRTEHVGVAGLEVVHQQIAKIMNLIWKTQFLN